MELLKYLRDLNKSHLTLPPNPTEAIDKAVYKFISMQCKHPTLIRISHEMYKELTRELFPNIGRVFESEIDAGVYYKGVKIVPTKLSNINMVLLY